MRINIYVFTRCRFAKMPMLTGARRHQSPFHGDTFIETVSSSDGITQSQAHDEKSIASGGASLVFHVDLRRSVRDCCYRGISMKNTESWKPSKFFYRNGVLCASRDTAEVGIGSRLAADIVAKHYGMHLKAHASGKLLDLGCGKVPLYEAYRDLITDSICADWENTSHQSSHLDLEIDLTKTLPFRDAEFNTIILSDVLEHLPDPQLLWHEMSRVLSPGGKVIMNVPFFYWLHEQPHDYYRYTEYALRRFVDIAQMRLVLLSAIGGAPEVMTDIFAKNALRAGRTGRMMSRLSQWMTLKFIDTTLGRKMSDGTKDSFPLGYFMVAEK
jgi:SAM-dependent methyltransferase